MSNFREWLLGSCAFALLLLLAPGVRATEWDQKVVATFNGPVEIPGHVLPAGTYVFKLFDSLGSREVVQVSNSDESRVLALTIAIPHYRPYPTEKAAFVFEERGGDSPQAIQAWYYPGYTSGHEFIYGARVAPNAEEAQSTATPAAPSDAAASTSSAAEESSPVMSSKLTTTEPTPADLTQSNQSQYQNQANQTQTPDASTTAPAAATDQTDKELPKTASSTPLIALIGALLLAGSLGLKALASRVS